MAPHLAFNYLLAVCYVGACLVNLWTGHYAWAWYWASALSILCATTIGFR